MKHLYKIALTITAMAIVSFFAYVHHAEAVTPAWGCAYVGQSANPTLGSGDETVVSVDFRNTGSQAWSNSGANPVRLGTSRSRDRASALYKTGWLHSTRPTSFTNRVNNDGSLTAANTINPGETARFSFTIVAPAVSQTTVLHEYFQLVVEGVAWLEDYGQHFPVTVTPKTYSYAYEGQTSPPVVMQVGERAHLTLDLRNTGTATWRRDSYTSFHVGTSHPLDRNSPFANETWLNPGRLANLAGKVSGGTVVDQDTVSPGEIARFNFDFTAPASGNYLEYFRPLVENAFWLDDLGIYFPTRIAGADYDYEYITQLNPPSRMDHGTTTTLKIDLLNTGRLDWSSNGSTPVRLGTNHPRDGASGFFTPANWLSSNRVHLTRNLTTPSKDVSGETTVSPGEVGEWEFLATAPSVGGQYYQYFTPVVEGVSWMKDVGIYFPLYASQPIRVGLAAQTTATMSSSAVSALVSNGMPIATVSAGTSVTLSYDGTYHATSSEGSYDSSAPILLQQQPNAVAAVSNLSNGQSFNKFRGDLSIANGSAGTWIVNTLNVEDYVRGIGEVPDSWPGEALKAQVVAARTYGAWHIQHPATTIFDIYDDTSDQVYSGYLGELIKPNFATAATQTVGQAIYYNGQIAQIFYCSDSGGATESNENVWGGTPIPYLRGVSDPYQKPDIWSTTVSNATLQTNFSVPGNIDNIEILATYPSGRIQTIRLTSGATTYDRTYLADTMRAKFTTRSDMITGLGRSGNDWVIAGRGFGHGIGMPQWGAYNQANQGRNFQQILQYYYTGITIGSL